MAKAYENYGYDSRNSYSTYGVVHLQDSAHQFRELVLEDNSYADDMIECQKIFTIKYRAARIRVGLVESDYDWESK